MFENTVIKKKKNKEYSVKDLYMTRLGYIKRIDSITYSFEPIDTDQGLIIVQKKRKGIVKNVLTNHEYFLFPEMQMENEYIGKVFANKLLPLELVLYDPTIISLNEEDIKSLLLPRNNVSNFFKKLLELNNRIDSLNIDVLKKDELKQELINIATSYMEDLEKIDNRNLNILNNEYNSFKSLILKK